MQAKLRQINYRHEVGLGGTRPIQTGDRAVGEGNSHRRR